MSPTGLVWSPIYNVLEERINSGDNLILIISPFAKVDALERLIKAQAQPIKLKIVCRWRPADLLVGASDLALYPFAIEQGWELYINDLIHLKLFIFDSNMAFTTSGNLTLHGLGYCEPANIETGTLLQLESDDWTKIYEVINSSRRVDNKLYETLRDYMRSCPPPLSLPPLPGLFALASKKFTISSLPATQTPGRLAEYYFGIEESSFSAEEVRRSAHDLSAFRIPPGLDKAEFDTCLREAFRAVPFVVEFVAFLKEHGSLRFGAVNDWIHEKCEDVPLPYKWEMKENTRILYNWLEHLYPEIEWNIPGAHSQVIYWRGSADQDLSNSRVSRRYQAMFSNLSNRERGDEWKYVSNGAAPHQPLLLLAVIGLYDQNPQRSNMVVLDDELERTFNSSFSIVVPSPHPTTLVMPFIALHNEPFWHLEKRRGAAEIVERIRTRADFDQVYSGARLDENLHELLQLSDMRFALRKTILDTYFPVAIRQSLRALCEPSSPSPS